MILRTYQKKENYRENRANCGVKMTKNKNLNRAKKVCNDEFYTCESDVLREVNNYVDQFKDKIIYLPCDDAGEDFFEFYR